MTRKKWAIFGGGGCGVALLVLVMMAMCVAVVGRGGRQSERTGTEGSRAPVRAEVPEAVAAPSILAADLHRAYETNALAADQRYKDQRFRIVGVVRSIDEDILGRPFVALEGSGSGLFGVQCMLEDGEERRAMQLSPGQSVTLEGRVDGQIVGSVIARDCVFIQ